MKILALEFSSPQRSVAVVRAAARGNGLHEPSWAAVGAKSGTRATRFSEVEVSEVVDTGPGATGALAMIDQALREAKLEREQIECLALGLGPGSYTGIRAAIALAQGWQLACGVKLLGISSAECLALQAQTEGLAGRVNVVIDAQRGEFYLSSYDIGMEGDCETLPLRLATLAEVRERDQAGGILIGPEVTRWFPTGRICFPRAAILGRLALSRTDYVAGEKLEPIYLRETKFVKAPPPRALS
jgi:tRNA threonylcarbamoyl adenosine modification protein YeaZ